MASSTAPTTISCPATAFTSSPLTSASAIRIRGDDGSQSHIVEAILALPPGSQAVVANHSETLYSIITETTVSTPATRWCFQRRTGARPESAISMTCGSPGPTASVAAFWSGTSFSTSSCERETIRNVLSRYLKGCAQVVARAEEVIATRFGNRLWVSARGDGSVKRIDLDFPHTIKSIAVGSNPSQPCSRHRSIRWW